MTSSLTPSFDALLHSEKLIEYIKQEIELAGGQIDFAHFMQLALYAPGLGYYSAGMHKLGRAGDFVTAPEISPLFAQTIARQFQQILLALDQGDILEFGAGTGRFARDVLLQLEEWGILPRQYFILEVSPDLRERQQAYLQAECPHLLSRVVWLDTLPTMPFNGIIFANEVLDAMPVHRFELCDGAIWECMVAWEDNQFVWRLQSPSELLQTHVETLMCEVELPENYRSEVNLLHAPWLASVAALLNQGVVLLIDYGYGSREYYHPERSDGTLKCFYQHHHHHDPLTWIGLQDITAHVDFTHIAESAVSSGLSVAGFTSQAAFLLACGLLDIARQTTDLLTTNQQIKLLTLPSEMGEVVKVMALTKNWEQPLLGFTLQDKFREL